jgi:hypothetical protein
MTSLCDIICITHKLHINSVLVVCFVGVYCNIIHFTQLMKCKKNWCIPSCVVLPVWYNAVELYLKIQILWNVTPCELGAWGSVAVKALCYWSGGPGINSRWCHWAFFLWLPMEPRALGSTQPLKMSTRDFSWGKGGRCVRLTTYHCCSAECQENPGL